MGWDGGIGRSAKGGDVARACPPGVLFLSLHTKMSWAGPWQRNNFHAWKKGQEGLYFRCGRIRGDVDSVDGLAIELDWVGGPEENGCPARAVASSHWSIRPALATYFGSNRFLCIVLST